MERAYEERLPIGWSSTRLSRIVELVSGQHLKPDSYNENNDGHPYFTGPADFGVKHPAPSRWTHEDRALAIEGDILITVKGAGIGKTNVLDQPKAFISRQLMAVRPILVDQQFTHLVLDAAYDQFQDQGQGIAIPGIGRDDILDHIVLLPPEAEQKRIVSKVSVLLSQIERASELFKTREEKTAFLMDSLIAQILGVKRENPMPTNNAKKTKAATPVKTDGLKSAKEQSTSAQGLVDLFEKKGHITTPDRLLSASRLTNEVDLFFQLLREARDSGNLEFSEGLNQPIRRIK